MSTSFCSAPWGALFYHTHSARVCCVSTAMIPNVSPMEFIKSDLVKQLRSDFLANKKPDSCKGCWELESKGLKSIRSFVDKESGSLDPTTLDVDGDYPISYIELRDGNLCNMGCRMCNPEASSVMQTEFENNPDLRLIVGKSPIKNKDQMSDDAWEELRQMAPGYRHINITGGEPMLQKRILDFLQFLLDSGNHKNTRVHICTNTSVINPYIIDLFTKLDDILLTMSIDAVGEVAEYQRYGTKWNQVSNNIYQYSQLLPNVDKYLVPTITAYSILDFSNFTKYMIDLYHATPNHYIGFHARSDSWTFSPDSLIGELKYRAIDEINKSIDLINAENISVVNFTDVVSELTKIKNLLETKEDDVDKYTSFVQKTQIFDKVRNQSFESVFGYKLY
jgi:organic radical activating enzyme